MFLLLFTQIFALFCRDFSGTNVLACDCNVYNSLVSVINALSSSRAAVCASPPRVASVQFYPGGSYENHPVQDFTCCMYLYFHVYTVKPPLLDTLLRTSLPINCFLLRTLSITNTLYCRRLSDTGTSPLQTIYDGHLFITDTSLLKTLSITDTHLVWSLLRIFSLRTPVLCENLSLTDSFMETSLLRTPLYCKYPYLWYGHVFVTDTSQSLLQTPINCRPRWYGNVFITDIAYYRHHPLITDTSGTDMSLLRTPLKYIFLLRTLLWTPLLCRHLHITDSSIIP